jgi:hypothetical protein
MKTIDDVISFLHILSCNQWHAFIVKGCFINNVSYYLGLLFARYACLISYLVKLDYICGSM